MLTEERIKRMEWENMIIRYRIMCKKCCESKFRREKEYGSYLKLWFENKYDAKKMNEPMPYNIYMQG